MPLHWGIVGASKIAHDFCVALHSNLTVTEHRVIAIASRSKTNAEDLARKHNVRTVYESYEKLAKDRDVEVVYIAVLNPQHFPITKLMIEYRKHVVCVKPFAMNYKQAQELISLGLKQRVFVMEGLWSRFFPVYRHLSRLIDLNCLGAIKEVYVNHGFNGYLNDRILNKEFGGGVVLNIGCYALQFALFVFREAPKAVKATGKINKNCVDLYFEAELIFSEGRKAIIVCSALGNLSNQATIISTKGPVCIPEYWCPTKYIALGKMHRWDLVSVPDCLNYTNSVGLKYQADAVAKCIRSSELHCNLVSPEDTLLIAKIQDEIRKQIGVQYECDKA